MADAGPAATLRAWLQVRLAYLVAGRCVLRYDNEAGKGDHKHLEGTAARYAFSALEKLIAEFQREIRRWNDENRDA